MYFFKCKSEKKCDVHHELFYLHKNKIFPVRVIYDYIVNNEYL